MDSTKNSMKAEPLLNKMLFLFMLAMVLANVGGEMYGMLLPLYLKELNTSVVKIGLFFTISQIIPLVVQILGGWVSDSLGCLRSTCPGSPIMGALQSTGAFLCDRTGMAGQQHPSVAQIQAAQERWT